MTSPRKNFRIVALAGFPAAVAAAACGTLLNIEDRELDTQQDAGGGTIAESGAASDAGESDGPLVESPEASLPPIQGSICEETACKAVGGNCDNQVCVFTCDKKNDCEAKSFTCPPNNDCAIDCAGQASCKSSTCTGGRSCTFRCRANDSCKSVRCSGSETCRFDCFAPDHSCEGTVTCDAKDCEIQCRAKHACGPITATATRYCDVVCSGEASCLGGKLSCIGADASTFNCSGKESCKDGIPTCKPEVNETCKIVCKPEKDICAGGVCCQGTSCDVTPGVPINCK